MSEPFPAMNSTSEVPPGVDPANSFTQMYGRRPLMPGDILHELGKGPWVEEVIVAPQDFLFMSNMTGVMLDKDGKPYFLLANTKVRPAEPRPNTNIDLRDWAPSKIMLAVGDLKPIRG